MGAFQVRCRRCVAWPWGCWLALAACGPAAAAERYEGLAHGRDDQAVLYRETHWLHEQGGVRQHLVLYRCPDGAPFARKRLRESPSAQAPDFDFLDARDGYCEGVRTSPSGGREVFVQTSGESGLQVRPLALLPDAVIDAGFDHFVRTHWASLSSGRPATVHFLLPSRFEHLRLSIADARDGEVAGRPVRRVRMTLAAWYGFAAPAIDLAYEPDGQRLVEFRGIGTIRDGRGRYLDVRIEFPVGARAPVSEGEVAAASEQALVTRCVGGVL